MSGSAITENRENLKDDRLGGGDGGAGFPHERQADLPVIVCPGIDGVMGNMNPVTLFKKRNACLKYTDVGLNAGENDILKSLFFNLSVKGIHRTTVKMQLFDGFVPG